MVGSPALLVGLLAAALFGAATPASKVLLESVTPFQLAGLLYIGAAIGVLPFIIKERSFSKPWAFPPKTRIRLIGAILFGGVLGPVFLLFGLRIASSASVALWLNLELVATVLLGYLFFRDRLTLFSSLAAIGTLAAATLLAAAEGAAGVRAGLLVLIACVCWGMDNHLTALIDGIPPSQTTFWKGVVAGTVNLFIGLLSVGRLAALPTVGFAVVVGVFAYGASIVLYIMSAQHIGATRSQIVFSSSPFFGVLLSAILSGESIVPYQGLAILLIMVSLVLLTVERHDHKHVHAALAHEHWHRHDDHHHDHEHFRPVKRRWHTHWHEHAGYVHAHPHWPDLHHRHNHSNESVKASG